MRTKPGAAGFSLIELLVAFVILVMVMSVVYSLLTEGSRRMALARDYSEAILLAESQLAQVGRVTPLTPGITEGELADKYRWRLQVELAQALIEPAEDRHLPTPYRVELSVDWAFRGQARQVSLSTLRMQPAETAMGGAFQ